MKRLLTVAAALCLISLAAQAQTGTWHIAIEQNPMLTNCVVPPSGMVAWWPLDETSGTTASDIAGVPNNGTHVNGPTPIGGMVGGALRFDGANDHVRVPDHAELDVGTGDFTLDAWVRTKASSGVVILLDKRSGATPQGYSLFLANGRLGFQMANGVGSATCSPAPALGVACVNYVASAPSVADGQWHHVAAVVDRTNLTTGVRLYVDGVVVFTGAPMTGNLDNSSDLYLGVRTPGMAGGGFFPGDLDEVEIINRALTSTEIQSIFNAGSAGKCKEPVTVKPTADLGDAPDRTNSTSSSMTAYPGTPANFPTVFNASPPGPKHLAPKEVAWLGMDVSFENEADLLPDADGVTNIDPATNAANRDQFDDGLVLPASLPHCGQVQFQYLLSTPGGGPTPLPLYVNVWLDYNRDGDWEDIFKCALSPVITGLASEWAVQNAVIPAGTLPGPHMTLLFTAANLKPGEDMWVRITLSDSPAPAGTGGSNPDGRGPAGGYKIGETEDYLWKRVPLPEPGRAKICVFKFSDLNGDGVRQTTEPLLPGWQFNVTPNVGTVTTGPGGSICFGVSAPGTYTITEIVQSGWTPTTLNPQTVTVQPGLTVNVFFGNKKKEEGRCDLKIEKRVSPSPLVSGQQATFAIVVTNVGTAPCPGPTTVTETVPAGLTLVSASGTGWVCVGPVCTYAGTIPVGGTVTVTYTFNVTAPPGTTIENCARLANTNDTNPANNTACVKTPVVGRCDLAIKKEVKPSPLVSGQPATFTITVTNVGTAPCPGPTTVTETAPAGLTFVSASGPGWICVVSGTNVICTYPSPIPAGGSVSVTLIFNVTAKPGASITNCAAVSNRNDQNPGNDRVCLTIRVVEK